MPRIFRPRSDEKLFHSGLYVVLCNATVWQYNIRAIKMLYMRPCTFFYNLSLVLLPDIVCTPVFVSALT